MSWLPVLTLAIVLGALGLWAVWANVRADQELRSAICDRIRTRGVIIPGVLEQMDGFPGPGEQMPAKPGDAPSDPISEAVT